MELLVQSKLEQVMMEWRSILVKHMIKLLMLMKLSRFNILMGLKRLLGRMMGLEHLVIDIQ
jgi:hypothetical protein